MSLDLPKVSVVVPVYNGEEFLSEAIESVIAQTCPDWEIIAVDDGSTDKTLGILRGYEQKLSSKIQVITQENSGLSTSRNNAIKKATGKYIAFLDSDDLWLPTKLEKQIKFLDLNNEVGLLFSDSYYIDSNGDIDEETYIMKTKPYRGWVFKELLYRNFIPQPTVMLRAKVLKKIGVFNPNFLIAPDYDLWLRIAEHYPIDFIAEPLAKYRFHEGGISRDVELMTNEDLQILGYWLNKKPELRIELKSQIRRKKAHLHYQLGLHYYHNHKIKKAIWEFIKWGLYKSTPLRS